MIRKLRTITLLIVLVSCSESDKSGNNKAIEAEFTVKKELLGTQEIIHESGFSFYPPAGWELSEKNWLFDLQLTENYQIFIDPLDSSALIISNEAVELPKYENEQVSNFSYNNIPIQQKVLQNSNSVLFSLEIGNYKKMYIIFAIPRQHIQSKATFVESSIGSIKHF